MRIFCQTNTFRVTRLLKFKKNFCLNSTQYGPETDFEGHFKSFKTLQHFAPKHLIYVSNVSLSNIRSMGHFSFSPNFFLKIYKTRSKYEFF